jgi:glycosyltransferase involved in cell wall biosynthesis
MPEDSGKPLLTFALAAMNQERFIREAVEAAFAQTYSPLEIILSDDCSSDRTFEIMSALAVGYRGPHRVVLNRNPICRSIGGHINRIMEISNGELILAAAGDDVSLPARAQVVRDAWEYSGRRATSIHSSIIQINESGGRIDQVFHNESPSSSEKFIAQEVAPLGYVETLEPLIFGCAHAFSRKLFRVFGNLPEDVIHEDNAIGFRSVLAGKLLFINEPLVKYRIHGSNVYIGDRKHSNDPRNFYRQEERVRRAFRYRETMYRTFLSDLKTAREARLVEEQEYDQMCRAATRLQGRYAEMGKFLESGYFSKCRILWGLWGGGLRGKQLGSLVRRLAPRPVRLYLRRARGA